jgi:RNA-splicing ligase RtcB
MKNLKIYAKTIEEDAIKQIDNLMEQESFKNEKIRIMPDVHSGSGCVIGFTSTIGDKIIPNIVGVDLYCGMYLVELGNINLDLSKIDEIINENVPSGFNVHEKLAVDDELNDLYKKIENMKCFKYLNYGSQIKNGVGTLGGGNHFIEIDEDDDGVKYLVIHTGSRNLGNQVARIYMNKAVENCHGEELSKEDRKELIKKMKEEGRALEIEEVLKKAKKEAKNKCIDKDLCYLEGVDKENYLSDIKVCYTYAHLNRQRIALTILKAIFDNVKIVSDEIYVNNQKLNSFETLHNYIDLDNNLIRKGAISAQKGELVLIPINMRDGSLICKGLGNKDWNCSAPHGAGRLMSRKKAKETIDLEMYKESMKDIYSSTVCATTIDEAPQAYKSIDEIKGCIKPTVKIIKQIKPIYNFKATDEQFY